MPLKLHGEKSNVNTLKALVVAKFAGVEVESHDTKDASKSPMGKTPVLETEEGNIWGANAVARHIAKAAKKSLVGASAFEASAVEQWIEYASTDIDLPAAVWVFPIQGIIPNNNTAVQKAKGDIRKALENLNKVLQTKTFLVGQRISLADIVVAFSLLRLYELVLDGPFRKQFVNANRWFTTIVNQPEFIAVVGQVKLCEKMQVAKETEEKKPEAKKEEPKKAEPKKEEKKPEPKKEQKKKDEDEEEDESHEEKAKGPNPLDLLPPSKFIMDEWKRMYSNNDTRTVAIPWLWEHYDKEGYSCWIGNYKYNDELEKLFMTCNLVSGFLQRLEKLRKYGFGSVIILGAEPKLQITCAFLVRGTSLPQEMLECDDVEHYTWTKVDTDNAEQRETFNKFLAWDMDNYNQGKTFK